MRDSGVKSNRYEEYCLLTPQRQSGSERPLQLIALGHLRKPEGTNTPTNHEVSVYFDIVMSPSLRVISFNSTHECAVSQDSRGGGEGCSGEFLDDETRIC